MPEIDTGQFREVSSPTPREIADSIFWLGCCRELNLDGQMFHNHISAYVIVGPERALMVDTGSLGRWPRISELLDVALNGRQLDYLAPTHPEVAHAWNIRELAAKYPSMKIVGDVRDLHLYFPELVDRFLAVETGASLRLGGDYEYVVVPAPIKDLPSTTWGYESGRKVLFVADAFGYVHCGPASPEVDMPLHEPGDCWLVSTELDAPPNVQKTEKVTRSALDWSRYLDATPLLAEVDRIFQTYPTSIIAPAHGNVITNPEIVYPVIRDAFRLSFGTAGSERKALSIPSSESTSLSGSRR